jgi:hypothetical protein
LKEKLQVQFVQEGEKVACSYGLPIMVNAQEIGLHFMQLFFHMYKVKKWVVVVVFVAAVRSS